MQSPPLHRRCREASSQRETLIIAARRITSGHNIGDYVLPRNHSRGSDTASGFSIPGSSRYRRPVAPDGGHLPWVLSVWTILARVSTTQNPLPSSSQRKVSGQTPPEGGPNSPARAHGLEPRGCFRHEGHLASIAVTSNGPTGSGPKANHLRLLSLPVRKDRRESTPLPLSSRSEGIPCIPAMAIQRPCTYLPPWRHGSMWPPLGSLPSVGGGVPSHTSHARSTCTVSLQQASHSHGAVGYLGCRKAT